MEKVLDSSRYFVLRIEHQGRHAFVGLGFNERSSAFDFNVAITDHKKDIERVAEVERMKQAAATEPQLDFSFKEGEKITINVKAQASGEGSSSRRRRAATSTTESPTQRSVPCTRAGVSAATVKVLPPKATRASC